MDWAAFENVQGDLGISTVSDGIRSVQEESAVVLFGCIGKPRERFHGKVKELLFESSI